MGGGAKPLGEVRIFQQPLQPRREPGFVTRISEEQAAHTVLYLVGEAANSAGDDGPALPHRLCHSESEPFCETFLHDYRCMTLQCVHDRGVLLRVSGWQTHEIDLRPMRMRKRPP